MWHNTDFEEARKHPEKLGEMTGRWITEHDAEQYVHDNWQNCVNALITGKEFVNSNLPPGYKYKPWTIDELLKATARGECVDDEGDWS